MPEAPLLKKNKKNSYKRETGLQRQLEWSVWSDGLLNTNQVATNWIYLIQII